MSGNIFGGRILWGAVAVSGQRQLVGTGQPPTPDTESPGPECHQCQCCKVLTLAKGQFGYRIRPTVKSMALGPDALGLGAPA